MGTSLFGSFLQTFRIIFLGNLFSVFSLDQFTPRQLSGQMGYWEFLLEIFFV